MDVPQGEPSEGDAGEIVVYTSPNGGSRVQLRAVDGTVWLAQAQIAELYGTSVPNIAQVARRVLADGEVTEATINSELRVAEEGGRRVRRQVKVYNLDLILAIGYRVSTPRAVQFRGGRRRRCGSIWSRGSSSMTGGFVIPRARTTSTSCSRASATSGPRRSASKLVFAITGRTAAELVLDRSDPSSSTLGLTTWEGPRIRKADVVVAKNYLQERRRTQEVEDAAGEEADDIGVLLELEQRRDPSGTGRGD